MKMEYDIVSFLEEKCLVQNQYVKKKSTDVNKTKEKKNIYIYI